jgi:uncharacterized Zn finger protein
MSRYRYEYYNYFPKSQVREAKGGIKAQSKRGAFGTSWWARRWIEVLESFNIGARLNRGRSYARKGLVLSINIENGSIAAKVQGSRPRPYDVRIKVKILTKKHWSKLGESLAKQAIFAAKLLAGQMPDNIEEAFKNTGLSLFPDKRGDLKTDCSCPDWSNPCKHIAAVYYLLGEEFSRDPFLIFKLRGLERKDLISLVGSDSERNSETTATEIQEDNLSPSEPLVTEPEEFWGQADRYNSDFGEVRIPPVSAALPKQLHSFPFWRGKESFLPAMEEIYRRASQLGMDAFLSEEKFTMND